MIKRPKEALQIGEITLGVQLDSRMPCKPKCNHKGSFFAKMWQIKHENKSCKVIEKCDIPCTPPPAVIPGNCVKLVQPPMPNCSVMYDVGKCDTDCDMSVPGNDHVLGSIFSIKPGMCPTFKYLLYHVTYDFILYTNGVISGNTNKDELRKNLETNAHNQAVLLGPDWEYIFLAYIRAALKAIDKYAGGSASTLDAGRKKIETNHLTMELFFRLLICKMGGCERDSCCISKAWKLYIEMVFTNAEAIKDKGTNHEIFIEESTNSLDHALKFGEYLDGLNLKPLPPCELHEDMMPLCPNGIILQPSCSQSTMPAMMQNGMNQSLPPLQSNVQRQSSSATTTLPSPMPDSGGNNGNSTRMIAASSIGTELEPNGRITTRKILVPLSNKSNVPDYRMNVMYVNPLTDFEKKSSRISEITTSTLDVLNIIVHTLGKDSKLQNYDASLANGLTLRVGDYDMGRNMTGLAFTLLLNSYDQGVKLFPIMGSASIDMDMKFSLSWQFQEINSKSQEMRTESASFSVPMKIEKIVHPGDSYTFMLQELEQNGKRFFAQFHFGSLSASKELSGAPDADYHFLDSVTILFPDDM